MRSGPKIGVVKTGKYGGNFSEIYRQEKLPVTECKKPLLTVFYRMGWDKRDSGNLYNKISGPTFMIGVFRGKFMPTIVVTKKISWCGRKS